MGGERARRTLVDGLEALLLVLEPVGVHELELPALLRVPGRRHVSLRRPAVPRSGDRRRRMSWRECGIRERRREEGGGAAVRTCGPR